MPPSGLPDSVERVSARPDYNRQPYQIGNHSPPSSGSAPQSTSSVIDYSEVFDSQRT